MLAEMKINKRKFIKSGLLKRYPLINSVVQYLAKGKRRGSALTITILMTVLVSISAGSLSKLTMNENQLQYRNLRLIKAFHLAEAGVAEAYALIKGDWTLKDDPSAFPETNVGEGIYDVTMLDIGGRVVIESKGKVYGIEKTLLVEITSDPGDPAFDYAIFGGDEVRLENFTVNGDVHSNDRLRLRDDTTVIGTASADDLDVDGDSSATTEIDGAAPVPFVTFNFNYYYNLADPADRYTGNVNWSDVNLQPSNGVIYVNGDVVIDGTSQLTGAIVATGEISISGTFTRFEYGNLPSLMSRDKKVRVNGNYTFAAGLLYSGGAEVDINGNGTIIGVLIAFDEINGDDSTITFAELNPPGLNSAGPVENFRRLTYQE